MRHISGDDQDCLAACSSIYVYAKDQSIQFFEDLTRRLPQIHSDETFRFACYLLVASALDFSEHLRPLCSHPTTEFRVSALYSLGKLKQKENLLDIFIAGLDDPVPRVVHTTLQAMPASRDNQVLDAFSRIIDRYTTDEHYVLTNLEHRLREAGFHSIASFKRARSEVIATEEGDVSAEEGEIVSESGVLATWFQRIKKWLKM